MINDHSSRTMEYELKDFALQLATKWFNVKALGNVYK